MALVMAVVLPLALLVGVVLVGAAAVEDRSAGEVLASMRRKVGEAATVRYRIRIDAEETNESGTNRVRARGRSESRRPDRTRTVLRYSGGEGVVESIQIGGRGYGRVADSAEGLARQRWTEWSLDELDPGIASGRSSGTSLDQLLGAASGARWVGGARRTLGFRLEASAFDLLDVFGAEWVRGRAAIEDDRPERMEIRLAGDGVTARIVLDGFRWGEPVRIAVPARSDVDPTPSLDEEGVAAYQEVPLYQPAAIPRGWELSGAAPVSADEALEGCRQVSLVYEDVSAEQGPYLDLYEFETSCSEGRPERYRDFRAGAYEGFIAFDPDGTNFGEITVGDTVVQFETDLAPTVLSQVLGSLVPLDFERPPLATIPYGPAA